MNRILLILIFFLALFLRVYQLGEFPVGFHGDEASIGYNAYSLLKTAKDQNANFLPLAVDQWGDFRPAGYHYLAIIPVAILGLNELATRLPAAIFGAITIFAFYLLVKELFDKKSALLACFLLAISPWHIVTSRATSESVIALFLVIGGAYCFVKSFREKRKKLLLLAIAYFLFIASFLFYHAARFFVPLLAFFLTAFSIFILKPDGKIKKYLLGLNIFLILALLIIFKTSSGSIRPADIGIFNWPEGKLVLEEQIREDGSQNVIITRALHNKIVVYGLAFFDNYFQHLNGDFLFLKGGLPQRYAIPWSGNFYLIEAPFLILGFSLLLARFWQTKNLLLALPLFWLALGILPAALTFEDIPNIQRSIMALPAFIIIIAFGFTESLKIINSQLIKKILLSVVAIILSFNFILFLHNYFHHSLTHQPWYRNYGEKELLETIQTLSPEYKNIIMTTSNNNNINFYLFYLKIDPKYYQSLGSPRDKNDLQFQKITFRHVDCPLKTSDIYSPEEKEALYVNKGECPTPENSEELKIIRRSDNTPAFRILRLK